MQPVLSRETNEHTMGLHQTALSYVPKPGCDRDAPQQTIQVTERALLKNIKFCKAANARLSLALFVGGGPWRFRLDLARSRAHECTLCRAKSLHGI